MLREILKVNISTYYIMKYNERIYTKYTCVKLCNVCQTDSMSKLTS